MLSFKLIMIIFFLFIDCLISQVLPENRSTDWKIAGNKSAFDDYRTINIFDYGGLGDGIGNNDNAIQKAINANKGKSVKILFPMGIYKFSSSIYLNSNTILSGVSNDSTILDFDLNGENSLINIIGNKTKDTLVVKQISKKSNVIIVDNNDKFFVGDYFQIISDDDSLITSSWALHITGQICKIKDINQDTLFIENYIRRNYSQNENPV